MKEGNMKKGVVLVLAFVLAATMVFGAGAKEAKDDKLTFAVIPMFVGHPWFERCEYGAKMAAEDLGIDLVYVGPEKADAARQLDMFQDQVNKGVDAILVAVSEAAMWEAPIANAIAQGVPVFGFDIGGPGTVWLASGWETVQSGINIAEGIVKDIGGKGKVAILTGSLGSPLLAERQRAAESVFAKYPDIEVIGVFPTEDDYERALSVSESILQANPDLAGFACMVTTCVPASARAAENAGVGGKVSIWGVAMGQQNADYVKRGTVKGGLILDPGKMTYLGMKIAYDYVTQNGKLPTGNEEYGWAGKPVTVVDAKASYAPDVLLTAENVDDFEF